VTPLPMPYGFNILVSVPVGPPILNRKAQRKRWFHRPVFTSRTARKAKYGGATRFFRGQTLPS
jgi:hypothetical protein